MSEVFDYAEAQNDAYELLLEFGQAAILREPGPTTGPAYDPMPGVPIDHPCTVAVLDFDTRLIDGTLIRYGDLQVYMSAKGLAVMPDPATHRLIIGGQDYAIVPPVKTLSPAGLAVFYILQARR